MKIFSKSARKIKHLIYPYSETKTANQIITNRVTNLRKNLDENESYLSSFMEDFKGIDAREAESIFSSIIANRKSLEERARVNVLSVTIAVTIILGLLSFLFSIQNNIPDNNFIKIFIGILFILTLFYLIAGSITSLNTLNAGELKEIYSMSAADYKYLADILHADNRNKELVYIYSYYAELNSEINLKINNFISCSYANIRNALSLLGVIGITLCFIFILDNDNKNSQIESELKQRLDLLETLQQEHQIYQNNKNAIFDDDLQQLFQKQEYILNEVRNFEEDSEKVTN